jgi:drug/metabolite transporter (DMT)-like permease
MIDPGPQRTAGVATGPAGRTRTLKAAAAILIFGSLCPWVSALGFVSLNGLQVKLGWVTFGSGLAMLVLLSSLGRRRRLGLSGRRRLRLVVLLGLICVTVCVLVIVGVGSTNYAIVQPEWGLYMTLVAAATATYCAAAANRDSAASPQA